MPPRTKVSTAPSTMAELKATLWKAADKLRGSMDASQYKDVALGLIFLKYVSDAFDERREQLRVELSADGFRDDQIEQAHRGLRLLRRRRGLLRPQVGALGLPRREREGATGPEWRGG